MEGSEEGVDVGSEAVGGVFWGCFGTAFAASAHGGDVRESCGSGHGGNFGKTGCFARGKMYDC